MSYYFLDRRKIVGTFSLGRKSVGNVIQAWSYLAFFLSFRLSICLSLFFFFIIPGNYPRFRRMRLCSRHRRYMHRHRVCCGDTSVRGAFITICAESYTIALSPGLCILRQYRDITSLFIRRVPHVAAEYIAAFVYVRVRKKGGGFSLSSPTTSNFFYIVSFAPDRRLAHPNGVNRFRF